MNMNQILHQNIISSVYFKSLYSKKTYHEVIEEANKHVTSLEPFLKGTTPSTAFCLIYKMWTLRLTLKQINGLLNHKGASQLRAMGFIYLRYVCEPSQLWDWFVDYLDDDTEVQIENGVRPKKMTIAKICHVLLVEPKWLGTMLPRIPVLVARDIEKKLKEYEDSYDMEELPDQNGGHRDRSRSPSYRRRSRSPDDRYQRRRSLSRSPRRSDSSRRRDSSRDRYRSRSPVDRHRRHSEHRHRDRTRSRDRKHKSSSTHRRDRSRSRDRHHDHDNLRYD